MLCRAVITENTRADCAEADKLKLDLEFVVMGRVFYEFSGDVFHGIPIISNKLLSVTT